MRPLLLLAAVVLLGACPRAAAPTPAGPKATPTPVEAEGALHAVRCGDVTAVWSGTAPEGEGAPLSYGVQSLAFRFADGRTLPFTPAGELQFSDWRFDVFSPDCTRVALLADRYGPYRVAEVSTLAEVLSGTAMPVEVRAPVGDGPARVHSDALWRSGEVLEFYATCCGTTDVYRATVGAATTVTKVYSAETTGTLKRSGDGWEVAP